MSDFGIASVATRLMWLALAGYVSAIGLFVFGSDTYGFVAIILAVIAMLLSISSAVYCFLQIRCRQCGKRFFDLVFPLLPVQSGCKSCGASRSEGLGQQEAGASTTSGSPRS